MAKRSVPPNFGAAAQAPPAPRLCDRSLHRGDRVGLRQSSSSAIASSYSATASFVRPFISSCTTRAGTQHEVLERGLRDVAVGEILSHKPSWWNRAIAPKVLLRLQIAIAKSLEFVTIKSLHALNSRGRVKLRKQAFLSPGAPFEFGQQ